MFKDMFKDNGLYPDYRLNCPLYVSIYARHIGRLPQDKPSPSLPMHQHSVIKMNSTFLECVDKYYYMRGLLTFMGVFFLFPIFVFSFLFTDLDQVSSSHGGEAAFLLGILSVLVIVMCLWYVHLGFRKELFRYTHYPIRFNRRTRQVYVFRHDGTVMTEDWDELYFTVGKVLRSSQNHAFDIRGHRWSEDGRSILSTFSLPSFGGLNHPDFYSQWELVRRYMEDGPEAVYDVVTEVLPRDRQRESLLESATLFMKPIKLFGGFFNHAMSIILGIPFITLPRWVAMHTCRIPRWPEEIEAICKIEPGDPFVRDAGNTPSNSRLQT